ncbi:MAG: hypothetical protein ABI646_02475 [Acidobacteriota bacterium]
MRYLFDYGEGLLCFLPVFVIMSLIAAALIWNSLPSRTVRKKGNDDKSPDGY